jgi:hypothetical protein
VAACREPTGGECWLISYSGSVALEPRWAGWYLFAQESRYSGSSMGIPSLVPLPTPVTLRRSATVSASAPLGPVCCVAAPVVKKAPTASVRARALRRKGRLHVGRVTCETRCSVQLKVSGGKRRAVYRTLRVTGAKALTVPVRHGKLKVRVIVDGTLVTSGPTTAR